MTGKAGALRFAIAVVMAIGAAIWAAPALADTGDIVAVRRGARRAGLEVRPDAARWSQGPARQLAQPLPARGQEAARRASADEPRRPPQAAWQTPPQGPARPRALQGAERQEAQPAPEAAAALREEEATSRKALSGPAREAKPSSLPPRCARRSPSRSSPGTAASSRRGAAGSFAGSRQCWVAMTAVRPTAPASRGWRQAGGRRPGSRRRPSPPRVRRGRGSARRPPDAAGFP